MTQNKSFLFILGALVLCGNVFAVSPYATAIEQNVRGQSFLRPVSFPTTAADASFIARMESKRDAYMPYFNRSAFTELSIAEQDEIESMFDRAEAERLEQLERLPRNEYCSVFYDDEENCQQDDGTLLGDNSFENPPESVYDDLVPPGARTSPTSDLYMSMALTDENVAKYNLKTFNGGCTPSERSDWWSNKIRTSSKYETTDAAFEKFMVTAFRKEGGCAELANDTGGYTCYGCASNGLCRGVDMRTITRAKVENLAYNNLYKKYHVHRLPDAFRGYAMWGMWGSGPITGIHLFQTVLGVPHSNKIDNATVDAAKNYRGDFGAAYTQAHEKFYRNIVAKNGKKRGFLRGWLNSLALLKPSGCHVVPKHPIKR